MSIAILTLSADGAALGETLTAHLPDASLWVHDAVEGYPEAGRFSKVTEKTAELFGVMKSLVYILPCGVAVRAIAPLVRHKLEDPAVVVVDVRARWAVSLLSGHEGGANDLAIAVGNILGAEPVVTTTSDAARTLVVGVGCRRGTAADDLEASIRDALAQCNACPEDVRLLATAAIKADEPGLQEAARRLGLPLRVIEHEEICRSARDFERSDFVESKIGLPAVAEPAALLAGRRTSLLLPKTTPRPGVTVAVAREG